jgi:rhamnogalacturonan endolyase
LTPALFRIGEWDGTPTEFINGDKINRMHPSDIRMSPWNPGTYTVGTSQPATGFPAYQWMGAISSTTNGVNSPITVQFKLKASQISTASKYRLRVGITTAYAGARPKITINGFDSSNAASSTQPSTRTLTVGTHRGNNTTYNFNIAPTALIAGTNTLTIYPISGSYTTSQGQYLTPGYSIDAVDLIKTP